VPLKVCNAAQAALEKDKAERRLKFKRSREFEFKRSREFEFKLSIQTLVCIAF
jgi:hypothetical protein